MFTIKVNAAAVTETFVDYIFSSVSKSRAISFINKDLSVWPRCQTFSCSYPKHILVTKARK